MRPQWTADIDVDASLARALVATQFPEFAEADVEPFAAGWDNAAFLIGGRVVFRFPRRRIAARLIEREVALLPHIATRVPLAISAPRFVGEKTAAYPYVFAGYDLIDGTTSCSVALSEASRSRLAEPLARFLRALHGIEPANLLARGLPFDELGRLDHDKRLRTTRERAETLRASDRLFTRWMETHPPTRARDAERRVLHGDLYARHVLLDARGEPTGIIDWGDIHFGDTAVDIAIAHLILPAYAHDRFRAAYGPIDERTWNAARYRAIYHAILELDYGIRTGDAGMRESGALALRLMRDFLEL